VDFLVVIGIGKINGFSSNHAPSIQQRRYSTSRKVNLNPLFVSGFTDAEGSFWVSISKNKNLNTGWRAKLYFEIHIHNKDLVLLEQIQKFFCVGKIYKKNNNTISYLVESVKDLQVIREHFEKYPLHTKKRADFELWVKILDLIQNKEHLTLEGLHKIVAIRASLNKGLTDNLKAAFPNIIPVPRPSVLNQRIEDPNWLAGFTTGEGCFYINIKNSSSHVSGFQVPLGTNLN